MSYERGDRASEVESSMCARIACIDDVADQNGELERRNRGISHVWSSYMRITPKPVLTPEGKPGSHMLNVNRFSLPIPKL